MEASRHMISPTLENLSSVALRFPFHPAGPRHYINAPYVGTPVRRTTIEPVANNVLLPMAPSCMSIPVAISPISHINHLIMYQHMLRFHQLQQAFQLGMERMKNSTNPSNVEKDLENVDEDINTVPGKKSAKQSPDRQANVISHWDPWFHRRMRKNLKKDLKGSKEISNNLQEKRINKTVYKKKRARSAIDNKGSLGGNKSNKRNATETTKNLSSLGIGKRVEDNENGVSLSYTRNI